MYGGGQSGHSGMLLLARLALGALFVWSGYHKLIGFDGFAQSLAAKGLPNAHLLAVLAVAAEFGGGCAIVLGLFTRWAALLMVAFVVVATAISHRYWEVADAAARSAQMLHFMKNLSILGGFLALAQVGAGRFSLDGALFRRK